MKWFLQIFKFYIKASIHVALAVVSFVYITTIYLDIPLDINLALFLLLGTIPSYNFIKYGVEAKKYFFVSNSYQKRIQIFSFIAFLASGYFAFFLPVEVWIGLLLLAVFIALYSLPLFPSTKNLRSLGILKIIIVGLVWTGTTAILPILQADLIFSWDVYIECLQRFFVILVLMIPFEIRDLETDHTALQTLPQRIGIKNTRIVGILMILFFFVLTFFKDSVLFMEFYTKALVTLVLFLLMLITPKHQATYFSSFWVEGIPVFWAGLLWILTV
jgi:hypothetical protein